MTGSSPYKASISASVIRFVGGFPGGLMLFPARMMARLLLVLGASLVTFGYSKCVFVSGDGSGFVGSSSGSGVGDDFSTTLVLRDSTGSTSTSFVMGEPIRFDLEIQNRANQTSTLRFPDGQNYDFYVLDAAGSRVRWRWSDGMTFTQAATQLTFSPYSTKAYSVTWNGVLADGTQLPAGNYRARGAMVADAFTGDPLVDGDLVSNVVLFTVR
jgi:intracellular proteinase inhibitor BsuPI